MVDWTGEYCILRVIAAGHEWEESGVALPVEAAVLRVRGGREVEHASWLIDPGFPVPASLRERSGRSEEDHRGGISPQAAAERIRRSVQGLAVVVYGREATEASFPNGEELTAGASGVADARQLAWLSLPYLRDHSLAAVAFSLLREEPSWRALEEARLVHRLLAACRKAWWEGHPRVRAAVLAALQTAGNPWHHYLAGKRPRGASASSPAFPDLVDLLSPPGGACAGRALFPSPEHPGPSHARETGEARVDPEEAARFLAPGGPLSRHHPAHEARPQQAAMARAVAEALNDSAFLAVEAGTGVGKSLAYLVPGTLHARTGGGPLVVSTYTRNLQEQLFQRDLPLLSRALGSLDFTILKGRSNYLCLRRWSAWCDMLARGQPVLHFGELSPAEGYAFLASWMTRSPGGDLEEISLDLRLPLARFLEDLSSDSDECPRSRCPMRERCWVERARLLAARSQVVVNHALLLSHAAAGEAGPSTPALPAFRHLVIDEAHHLEDVATEAFGTSFSLESCLRDLEELSPGGGLRAAWSRLSPDAPTTSRLEELSGEAHGLSFQIMELTTQGLAPLQSPLSAAGVAPREGTEPYRCRISAGEFDTPAWESLCARGRELAARLQRIASGLAEAAGQIASLSRDDERILAATVAYRGEALAKRLEREAAALLAFFRDPREADHPLHIRWAERAAPDMRSGLPPRLLLRCAPVSVGEELAAFLGGLEAAVLTSASLRVSGERDGFAFFLRRTGLERVEGRGRELRLLALDSPFDYASQSRLFAVTDLPEPATGRAYPNHPREELCALLEDVLSATGGKALVLLTSHQQIRYLHSRLRPRLERMGISCLCQRRGIPNALLLERFREDRDSVLLATEAFW